MTSDPQGCFQKENGTGKEGHSMWSAYICHSRVNSTRLNECLLCAGTPAGYQKFDNEQNSVLALEILTNWVEKNTDK